MFPTLSRLTFLAGGTAMALAGCVSTPIPDAATIGAAPLKEHARRKSLRVGAEVSARVLTDPAFTANLTRDFEIVLPENTLLGWASG